MRKKYGFDSGNGVLKSLVLRNGKRVFLDIIHKQQILPHLGALSSYNYCRRLAGDSARYYVVLEVPRSFSILL